MLDFSKLLSQIEEVSVDSLKEVSEKPVFESAMRAFDDAAMNWQAFEEALESNRDYVLWPLARPLSNISEVVDIAKAPERLCVLGVDGSQIMPSHHEVHSCYLLNVGLALITYGEKHKPYLETFPRLYHRPEDLYPLVDRRRVHIDELYVSLERTLFEIEVLAKNAVEARHKGLPVVALYDGSLIPWSVDKMPEGYVDTFFERVEKLMRMFLKHSIPLIGYVSHSRSSDVVNMLRTYICPYEVSNCKENCGDINEEDFPCSEIWPLTDRVLYGSNLELNQMSPIFKSGARVASYLDDQFKTLFAYANFGSEVARLEMPFWVYENPELLRLGVSAVRAQVEKGMGYPVVLAEAHHLAVIKAYDRDRFFDMMTRHLISLGARKVSLSPKERNKRYGFV